MTNRFNITNRIFRRHIGWNNLLLLNHIHCRIGRNPFHTLPFHARTRNKGTVRKGQRRVVLVLTQHDIQYTHFKHLCSKEQRITTSHKEYIYNHEYNNKENNLYRIASGH